MPKVIFNSDHKFVLDAMLLNLPEVRPGKMFGFPAYYVRGKLFACVYCDGVGIKVSEEIANSLLTMAHIVPFQPMGKSRMREWVQINRTSSIDYKFDKDIFIHSMQYVAGIIKK